MRVLCVYIFTHTHTHSHTQDESSSSNNNKKRRSLLFVFSASLRLHFTLLYFSALGVARLKLFGFCQIVQKQHTAVRMNSLRSILCVLWVDVISLDDFFFI